MKFPRLAPALHFTILEAALVLVACDTPQLRSGADEGTRAEHEPAMRDVDVSQALLMLDFLEGVSQGNHKPQHLEAVLESEGTELIIAQMNLAEEHQRTNTGNHWWA